MGLLILLRHGESQWNLENRFTGWVDVPLTEKGRKEALVAGELLRNIPIDRAFSSVLARCVESLQLALRGAGQLQVPYTEHKALNERMYGDLQGLNKDETAEKYGKEQVHIWRRSYDIAPPNGESLKDNAQRTMPYFEEEIMPFVKAGENILIVAHGNSLRLIVMALDQLTKDELLKLNIPNAVPIVYQLNESGEVLRKVIVDSEESQREAELLAKTRAN